MFWRSILSAIDSLFFGLVRDCFKLILYIADVEIFNEGVIEDFSSRVYMILAVLMFFKIAISTIQYLVDPEKLSDSSSGVGAIVKNSAIAILLLVVVPEIFKFARTAQNDLAAYVPSIIMGRDYVIPPSDGSENPNIAMVNDQAEAMTGAVMSAFYTPKKDKTKFDHGKVITLKDFRSQVTDGCAPFSLGNLGAYFSTDTCSWNYTIILPVIVAGLMIFVLISMAVDIAIRAFKFSILEIMAPIPIVSYIDKGGKGAFETWVKEVKDVYLDLFIRLAVVYFIVFAIQKLVENFGGGNGSMLSHMRNEDILMKGLVLIFIIIGLLLFAKEAPKYICDALGIKGSDKISNMFKRAGGMMGAVGAGLTAGAGNLMNKYNALKGDKWKGLSGKAKLRETLKAAASVGAGMTSGAYRGTRAALSGKSLKEAYQTGHRGATKARQNRDLDRLNGLTGRKGMKERYRARAEDFFGLDTQESLAENKQKAYSALHNDVGAFKKAVMGRIDKNESVAMRDRIKEGSAIDRLGQILNLSKDAIDASDNTDLKAIRDKFELKTWYDDKGNKHEAWGLKKNQKLGYYDLEAIRVSAEQEKIGTISSKMEPLKTLAQKELFQDSMKGTVEDTNGNLIDDMNFGDEGYRARGIDKANPAHSDITTAVQTARQHIAENAVPLGDGGRVSQDQIQDWFEGKGKPPLADFKDYGDDFTGLDDAYQRKSQDLSQAMAESASHLARESNKRRESNKDKG